MGYLANFHSLTKKSAIMRRPKIMRQRVNALPQGCVTPPDSMPKRKVTTPPAMVMTPTQSTALMPSMNFVFGVSMVRKKIKLTSEMPSSGRLM